MTKKDLIKLFRLRTKDKTFPYLWADEELEEFICEAELEASRRSHLLVDSSIVLRYQAGATLLAIDPSVIMIRRARVILPQGSPWLDPVSAERMDELYPNWEDFPAQAGPPTVFIPDYKTGFIRIHPIPTVAGSIRLRVVRGPKSECESLEIPERYQRGLLQWMLYRAYENQDSDTFDAKQSAIGLKFFEQEFGRRSSARNETWQAESGMLPDTLV